MSTQPGTEPAHTRRRHPEVRAEPARRSAALLALLLSVACAGTPTASERRAREDAESVRRVYRPDGARPALPELSERSTLEDLLRYALLNSPRVEAAYHAWLAAVERITPARSLPEPRLMLEADVAGMLEALMPGLMVDLPGPGKLRAAGDAAAAGSRVAYHAFEVEVLRAAYATKSAYHRLHYLEETLRVRGEALELLADVESLARQQVASGRGTIQDVLRAQIERERLATQVESLRDSRSVLQADLAAALGLDPSGAAVPLPEVHEPGPEPPPARELLPILLARNPALRAMEADVRRAEALLDLARTSRVPDASVGLQADVRADPVMWRPSASITLPIWRDKIAAEIAAAQADKRAARARLDAEQIALAAELASTLFLYRESVRDVHLYGTALAPKARQALEAARSGYVTGRSGFLDVLEAERTLLDIELSRVEALTRRDLTLASLSLIVVGVAPAGAPLLESGPPPASSAEAPR